MASLFTDKSGSRRVTFTDAEGVRRTFRLGRMDKRQAEVFARRIGSLCVVRTTGLVDAELAEWVRALPDLIHVRLARLGLVEKRDRVNPTLSALLDQWFASLSVKSSTLIALGQARRSMEAYFGADRLLRTVKPLDAEAFKRALAEEGLALATVAKRVKVARAVFRSGVRWRFIEANPFEGVKAGAMVNRARMHFVTLADTDTILAACPDHEWRLLVALSRFGGLRCPSEHLALRWADVDWEKNRLTVRSIKTEAHKHGGVRFVPLFPELLTHLREAFERAEPDLSGRGWVITRYRRSNCNLRTRFQRIIERAGVAPWPRLFHAMRAIRQTELSAIYPQHVVCAWLGNSEAVAQAHYLQATDTDIARAAGTPTPRPPASGMRPASPQDTSAGCAPSKAPHSGAASDGSHNPDSYGPERKNAGNPSVFPSDAELCATGASDSMTPRGFEPRFQG